LQVWWRQPPGQRLLDAVVQRQPHHLNKRQRRKKRTRGPERPTQRGSHQVATGRAPVALSRTGGVGTCGGAEEGGAAAGGASRVRTPSPLVLSCCRRERSASRALRKGVFTARARK
jgi:hypothetical protein